MTKTTIVTISDTHNRHRELKIPYGDVIIHAGDFSIRGTKHEIEDFIDWFGNLPHTYKILIAGNHDKGTDPDRKEQFYQGLPDYFNKYCKTMDIIVQNDDFCTIHAHDGSEIKIWGSPISPTFGYNWAWNRNRGQSIRKHWDKIPEDTDIVVTHGPPFGYGDKVMYGNGRVGCDDLLEVLERIKPKMHVFGHIHEDRGVFRDENKGITYVNTSSLTLRYEPYNGKAFSFDWEKLKKTESRGEDYE